MKKRVSQIEVNDVKINITTHEREDYICLTDMAKGKAGNPRAADVIKNWLRNRNTLEFLGTWEQLYNPNFKVEIFDHFRIQAGLPTFVISPKQWVEETGAIGIYAKAGRYGGTYAHKDIAFEFGSAISPAFKLYLIKEYQRLKQSESSGPTLEWNVARVLSKINYHLQTDAIKRHILPKFNISKEKEWLAYAEEADLWNVAVFGCPAKSWRKANPEHAKSGLNMRDFASINELAVLSNLEAINSDLIKKQISKKKRFDELLAIAKHQMNVLSQRNLQKTLQAQVSS